jgi:hypothetical protein
MPGIPYSLRSQLLTLGPQVALNLHALNPPIRLPSFRYSIHIIDSRRLIPSRATLLHQRFISQSSLQRVK